MKFLVVIEAGNSTWGAHVPDLPGCVAVGESKQEVLRLIKQAIDLHIEDLKDSAQPIPLPTSDSAYIETQVA